MKRTKEQKRLKQKSEGDKLNTYFENLYDKLKEWKFPPQNKIDMNSFKNPSMEHISEQEIIQMIKDRDLFPKIFKRI